MKSEGDGTLSYSIVDSSSTTNWNAADAQWRGDLIKDYTVQLDDVPSSARPGNYTGTIEAKQSCE